RVQTRIDLIDALPKRRPISACSAINFPLMFVMLANSTISSEQPGQRSYHQSRPGDDGRQRANEQCARQLPSTNGIVSWSRCTQPGYRDEICTSVTRFARRSYVHVTRE